MGQQDVYSILKNDKNKWFNSEDIYNRLPHLSKSSVCVSINRLKKSGLIDVKKRKLDPPKNRGRYRHSEDVFKYEKEENEKMDS